MVGHLVGEEAITALRPLLDDASHESVQAAVGGVVDRSGSEELLQMENTPECIRQDGMNEQKAYVLNGN